jgi:hypothetical protein
MRIRVRAILKAKGKMQCKKCNQSNEIKFQCMKIQSKVAEVETCKSHLQRLSEELNCDGVLARAHHHAAHIVAVDDGSHSHDIRRMAAKQRNQTWRELLWWNNPYVSFYYAFFCQWIIFCQWCY